MSKTRLATNYQLWRLNKEGLLTPTTNATPLTADQAQTILTQHLTDNTKPTQEPDITQHSG